RTWNRAPTPSEARGHALIINMIIINLKIRLNILLCALELIIKCLCVFVKRESLLIPLIV
ncbi:MAG TPA: hypothetical protein PLL08_07820, partial [Bacteroidales bacterium]|nr:hypothetical protein [Bacteroidales bacterium]HPY80408.1 hypothetical protein [Bacteroidales bacterium]HQA87322.1 hypothetical protein [Bacteroidales bacterium]HXK74795.1 hypothetical protein [Bacteroidales bacterium]